MSVQIRKATRRKAKLRLGLVAPAGAGKSFGALKIAFGLGGKVAVIDTERGSADLYADLGDYDVVEIHAPYTVPKYLAAIKAIEGAGYDTIIIDSLSHAWAGDGGLLDKQGKIADSGRANGFAAWRTVTPEHNSLVDAMLASPCHVIATMRAKTDYVMEKNEKGKEVPRKVGLAPVQRDGMDYEFTTVFDIGADHTAMVSKDRTSMFDGQILKLSEETGRQLAEWLNTGADAVLAQPVQEPHQEQRQGVASQSNSNAVADAALQAEVLQRLRDAAVDGMKDLRKTYGDLAKVNKAAVQAVWNEHGTSLQAAANAATAAQQQAQPA